MSGVKLELEPELPEVDSAVEAGAGAAVEVDGVGAT